jgi:hypothetical protein
MSIRTDLSTFLYMGAGILFELTKAQPSAARALLSVLNDMWNEILNNLSPPPPHPTPPHPPQSFIKGRLLLKSFGQVSPLEH